MARPTRYLDSLDWLSRLAPIAYSFRNTDDGHKVLYDDGILCEFAVFTPRELEAATYTPGRIVWCVDGFDATLSTPRTPLPQSSSRHTEFLLGEALTNLFVGLLREHRGEHMAAFRMIQTHALDRVMELVARVEAPGPASRDSFNVDRRFEARHPSAAEILPTMAQGYTRNRESAGEILNFLVRRFDVDAAMKQAIETLV